MAGEQHIFSVSELNQFIKSILDGEPELSRVLLRGEISNYKKYPSGHHYFTLKDAEGALKCVMFKREGDKLRFRPENGMSVIAQGRITVFQRDGVYQLYCTDLVPDGAGSLNIAFEQLKERLLKEGLFDRAHKKPIPVYPERIAVITSSAGAAVRDMIRILRTRYPVAEVLLLPVRVQGAEAAAEIAGAIRYANRNALADVIITGRGGGSLEDLWAFNEEKVARAIYASEIPVISAVGHEPDVTISDFVADARASTPSNAAEIAVPDRQELLKTLSVLSQRMTSAVNKQLAASRDKLETAKNSRAMRDPMNYIQEKRMVLDYSIRSLASVQERIIAGKKHGFVELAAKLDALSPMKVLVRGYCVAKAQGGLVRGIEQIPPGSRIELELSDGTARCTVDETEAREEKL